jgi:hypothetical protein
MGTSSVIKSVPNNDPTAITQLLATRQLAARFGARLRSLLAASRNWIGQTASYALLLPTPWSTPTLCVRYSLEASPSTRSNPAALRWSKTAPTDNRLPRGIRRALGPSSRGEKISSSPGARLCNALLCSCFRARCIIFPTDLRGQYGVH